jgi:hypothetical protein
VNGQPVVERYDAILRGIVAELLWLVSEQGDPSSAVNCRRQIIRTLCGYAGSSAPVLHMDIYGMIKLFGTASITHLSGNLISNLLKALNAKEPGTNIFTHRPILRLLIHDILTLPPEEAASADGEHSSDMTSQKARIPALQEKNRDVVHGNPAKQDFSAASNIQGRPALQQAPIQESGGYPLSGATPKGSSQRSHCCQLPCW